MDSGAPLAAAVTTAAFNASPCRLDTVTDTGQLVGASGQAVTSTPEKRSHAGLSAPLYSTAAMPPLVAQAAILEQNEVSPLRGQHEHTRMDQCRFWSAAQWSS